MEKESKIVLIDKFYPIIKRIMPYDVYCFLVICVLCFLVGQIVFNLLYVFFDHHYITFNNFEPYICSYILTCIITVPLGFLLTKRYVFKNSNLTYRVQLFRYCVSVSINILLSFCFLSIMVKYFGFNAMTSFFYKFFLFNLSLLFSKRIFHL